MKYYFLLLILLPLFPAYAETSVMTGNDENSSILIAIDGDPNSTETELRLSNFPDSFIEKFFKLYPDLKTQSSTIPSFNFMLPSAYAQSCPPNQTCNPGGQPPADNDAPTISVSPRSATAVSGDTVTITAATADADDDTIAVSWDVLYEDIDVTLSLSNNDHTASFVIPYDNARTSATYIIQATPFDEHQVSGTPAISVIFATVSPSTTTDLVTPSVTPTGNTIWSDDFEDGNLDGWTESGESDWRADRFDEYRLPPNHPSTNKVAEADDCDTSCTITRTSDIDMTRYNNEFLQFYRYIDTTLDDDEYLKLEVYDGTAWIQLDLWSQENSDNDDAWHLEKYSLSDYTDVTDFNIRFVAKMSSNTEDVGIDDVAFIATAVDTTPPVISAPSNLTFEATGTLTSLSESDFGTATATDNLDASPVITHDAPASFGIGDTIITWTATDAAGNHSTATQTITIQDTTKPYFDAIPISLTYSFLDDNRIVDYALPTASDLVDASVDVVCTPESGSVFDIGATTVTCTATDDSGNLATASFEVLVSVATPASNNVLSDTFDSTLDSWSFEQRENQSGISRYCSSNNTGAYALSHSSNHNGSATVVPSNVCWFGCAGGSKSFTFPAGYNTLEISLDYRSLANIFSGVGHINNAHMLIANSNDTVVYKTVLYRGERSSSLTDTDWQHHLSSTPMSSSDCPCKIFVYTADSWLAYWVKQIYFDNVTLLATNTSPQHAGNYVPPQHVLSVDALMDLQSSNSTAISSVGVYSNAISIQWHHIPDTDYKVVIAQSDSPRDKTADITSNNQYDFINLEPNTAYDVSVGVRGDDTTQNTITVTTDSDAVYHSNLFLSHTVQNGMISLSWLDENNNDNNRYRVQHSTDGITFEDTDLRPRDSTSISFSSSPEDTAYYRVFEWLGNQKLYSNVVSVNLP